jgi:hypothetical protein
VRATAAGVSFITAALISSAAAAGESAVASRPAMPDSSRVNETAEAIAHVQYLAGGSVYVDVGSRDGLKEGDSLTVSRDRAVIARLKASFLSSHRAACDTFGVVSPIRIGDTIRYRPHADALRAEASAVAITPATPAVPDTPDTIAAVVPPVGASATAVSSSRRSPMRLRGRLGARFIAHHEDSQFGADYRQPAADLRVDAFNAAGGHVDFAADLRSHRTTQTLAGGASEIDAATRAYRFSLTLHDVAARNRLTLGRQSSPSLAGISLFDGALAERTGARWGGGLFSGTEPEPTRLQFSNAILQHGVFVEFHQRPLAARRWSVTTGFVSSTENGELNRNFLFLQGLYFDPRWFASLAQEVDLNGGWKRDLGEPTVSPTSSYLTARARVSDAVTVRAGYDNRRNVRLYRDRETPETMFDDGYRQGGWAGATLDLRSHLRFDLEARLNRRAGDQAHTLTASTEVFRVTRLNAVTRLRASTFTSLQTESRLLSFSVGLDPTSASHVELIGGIRNTTDHTTGIVERAPWQGLEFDTALWRRWYLSGSMEFDRGAPAHSRQEYVGLSWRF